MARGMERVYKGTNNKGILSNSARQAKVKIKVTPIVTAMLTGHSKTRAYLHRFKILEEATCPCGNEDQTVEHLLNRCPILLTQREILNSEVAKYGNWPANKYELISKHVKSFLLFIKSINFDLL